MNVYFKFRIAVPEDNSLYFYFKKLEIMNGGISFFVFEKPRTDSKGHYKSTKEWVFDIEHIRKIK